MRLRWASVSSSPGGSATRPASEYPGRLTTIHSASSSSLYGSRQRASEKKLSAPIRLKICAPGMESHSEYRVSTVKLGVPSGFGASIADAVKRGSDIHARV